MEVSLYAILLVCSFFGQSFQLLLVPDTCGVSLNPYTRKTCGSPGITRESCIKQGCCYDDSQSALSCSALSSRNNCYKPANCAVTNAARKECGWAGISRAQCQCRGCCFDSSATGNTLSCFTPGEVTVKPTEKPVVPTQGPKSTPKPVKPTEKPVEPTTQKPVKPSRSCTMKEFPGAFISASSKDRQEFTDKTLEWCKSNCLEDGDFQCKSLFYSAKTKRCYHIAISYDDAKEKYYLRKRNDFTLYGCETVEPIKPVVNTCTWKKHEGELFNSKDSIELKKRMTLERCKYECETAENYKCVSYFFRTSSSRCVISTMSRLKAKSYDILRQNNKDFTLYSCAANETKIVDPKCENKMIDVMLVLDGSTSVSTPNFEKVKDFARGLVEKLPLDEHRTRVSVSQFGTSAEVVFKFYRGTNLAKVRSYIKNIKQINGGTRTDRALKSALDELAQARNASAKVIVLLTDGHSDEPSKTMEMAEKIHQQNINTFAIGVGNDVDKTELGVIATNASMVYKVDFNDLDKIAKIIPAISCEGAPVVSDDLKEQNLAEKCVVKTKYRMCRDIPVNERKEGVTKYMIDPDGSESDKICPIRVTCNFGTGIPQTIITHNKEGLQCASGCTESEKGCNVDTITYASSIYQATQMMKNALKNTCRQSLQLECTNAALTGYTFWRNAKGEDMKYWPGGDKDEGGCECYKTKSCAQAKNKCNCDSRDSTPRIDKGEITDVAALPVKNVAIGDIRNANQKACYRLGPLICQ